MNLLKQWATVVFVLLVLGVRAAELPAHYFKLMESS